jgi:hypothetical protein
MKNLNIYLKEGLVDWGDDDKLNKSVTNSLKNEIFNLIKVNSHGKVYQNKLKFDFSTNPVTVNYDGDIKYRFDILSLTNELFQWGEVSGDFDCKACYRLENLKGAPKKVGGNFICVYCENLVSLEGAPEEVGENFLCSECRSLKTLEGSPNKVGRNFNCSECKSLKTIKGAPKEVGKDFYCNNCGGQFTEDDVKKVSNVKREIFCKLW